jgi:hypothetical protein
LLNLLELKNKEFLPMGKYLMIYDLVCLAYSKILRDLVVKAIDDPDSEIDDLIVSLLDKLFNFGGK